MTDLTGAIAAKYEQAQEHAAAKRAAFEPDPELELLGQRLDLLRQHSPEQAAHPNLRALSSRLDTYRRRKAEHEGTTR